MKPIGLLFSLFALGAAPCVLASTINVPKDQPTIQAGINAANNGDTVLVSPGTYTENINFNGKAITVTSAMGSKVTIIDGGQANQVVTFDSGETRSSILRGFTIRNGNAICCGVSAGGILIENSSPTISHNTITKNFGCGINAADGSALIEDNVISYTTNVPPGGYSYCGAAQGSGILLGNQSGQIIGNTIIYNVAGPDGNGGGIYLWVGGAPLIENNIIAFNQAGIYSSGGGITMQNSGAPIIVQNLIIGNKAGTVGGGLDLEIPNDGSSTAIMVNNTIADNSTANENHGPIGADVYISGFYGTAAFWNNIITGATKNYLVYCNPTYGVPSPSFHNNDVFNSKGGDYVGTCAGQTGHKGNISADAKFVNPTKRNYELSAGSPAINAGTKSAPDLPKKDLAGHPRIVDGKIDMGAYEHFGKESDRE